MGSTFVVLGDEFVPEADEDLKVLVRVCDALAHCTVRPENAVEQVVRAEPQVRGGLRPEEQRSELPPSSFEAIRARTCSSVSGFMTAPVLPAHTDAATPPGW